MARVSHSQGLGWILVEYSSIELTNKCSRLRGPPRAAVFVRIPELILY